MFDAEEGANRVELAPGYRISRLIKGGWQLAAGHGAPPIDRDAAIADMFRFVEAGITTFDCADIYTGVEELIGEFLRRHRRRHGADAGSRLRVHTKFVPNLAILRSINRRDVERAIDRSLRRLGVDIIDLVQFHWWDYDIPRYVDVAADLAHFRRAGKIRYLGVTNFSVDALGQIVQAGVPIVANQVQYSVIDRRPERGMRDFCRANGIGLLCYGTLAGGFLSKTWLGRSEPRPPFVNRSLTKYRLIIEEFGGWALFQELLAALDEIGSRYAVGPAAVALRYILDKPGVASLIVGATSAEHLPETLRALDIVLQEADRERIERILLRAEGPKGDVYELERIKGGPHAVIMRYDLREP